MKRINPIKKTKAAVKPIETVAVAVSEVKHARCGAKLRNKPGLTCRRYPVKGMTRCRLHGGSTPVGIASHRFKDGRYSKHLPHGLADIYNAAKTDGELVGLREDIALITALTEERLQKLYSGESKDLWKTLMWQFSEYERSLNSDDKEDQSAARKMLIPIRETIKKGLQIYSAFEHIEPMIDTRRKLVEAESKRLKDLDQMISTEKAMGIIQLLLSIVNRNVTDPLERTAISAEIRGAIAQPTS